MNQVIFRLLPRSRTMATRNILAALAAVCLLGGAFTGAAFAGSTERTGTSGANELRIPVGPRGTALGGTTVADASGPEALFWNPAGLATLSGTDAYFSHLSYIADMSVNYFALTTKAGSFGNIGFSAKMLDVGDVIVTTEAAPDGTGDILSPTFATLGLSYARQFTDRVRFGTTIQFVNETVAQAHARGLAFDFGFQYDTGNGPTFGFVMKNFGTSMEFSGSDFEINVPIPDAEPGSSNRTVASSSSSFEMPSYFQIGAAYDLLGQSAASESNHLKVMTTFSSNNFTPDELRGGAEYMYKDMFALRAGYGQRVNNSDNDVYNGFSFGAGLNLKLGNSSRLRFDYANRMVKDYFDDTNEFAVRLSF
jgi:hypothetical protein